MIINMNLDAWERLYNRLLKSATFQEVETKKRRFLIWNKVKYYRDPDPVRLSIQDLSIISQTKKEIINRLESVSIPDNIQKDYFLAVRKPWTYTTKRNEAGELEEFFNVPAHGPTFDQIKSPTIIKEAAAVQIDLNAAYLTAVKNRGLLSDEIYKKFFIEESDPKKRSKKKKNKRHQGHNGEIYKYSKDARLISVGALAMDQNIISYENGKEVKRQRKYDEQQANVFWTAAADVGKLMIEILEKFKGFFYWVDAVFLPAEQEQAAREYIQCAGYNCHVKQLLLNQDGGKFETIETDGGEVKRYTVPAGKIAALINTVNDDIFLKETFEEYNELEKKLNLYNMTAEEARANLSGYLRKHYNIESQINLRYLATQAKKSGLAIQDIIKIETLILQREKDAIFESEILEMIIIKRIESISKRQELPPNEETTEAGHTIEREFIFNYL